MKLYFPLGLLGLIGIPVLILIYIIKSKYTEQTVASTYLWELSERFLKRRRISKLTGILTLILQILAVAVASLLIAHPVFTVPASANDYYFILDASASMNMTDGGTTRFDRAKRKIDEIIDSSLSGSSYSLVLVSDSTDPVFEWVRDKAQAKAAVKSLSAGWTDADCTSAMPLAQSYFDSNNSALVYMFTDKEYQTQNVQLVNVATGEANYAFVDYGYINTGVGVDVKGNVISYSRDASFTVELSADKGDGKLVKIGEYGLNAVTGEPTEFEISAEIEDYNVLRLDIAAPDSLGDDNYVMLYDEAKIKGREVLLVNNLKDAAYLYNAITLAGDATVTVVSPKKYESEKNSRSYGMYVFNGYTPSQLPTNAAIWLVDSIDGSGSGSGITYRGDAPPSADGISYVPKYTNVTKEEQKLLKGIKEVSGKPIAIKEYSRYGIPKNFTALLRDGVNTVLAAGLNENGDRQVVFAFEIGNSNLGGLPDIMVLASNLMEYSFPTVIDETSYVCGDEILLSVVPGCENMTVDSPSGKSTTIDTVGNDICSYRLGEVGTYTVNVKRTGASENEVIYLFSQVPQAESENKGGGSMILAGSAGNDYIDGFYDELWIFMAVVAVLLLVDWGVYCYEQYQLR